MRKLDSVVVSAYFECMKVVLRATFMRLEKVRVDEWVGYPAGP